MSVKLYSNPNWGVCSCGHWQWQHDNSTVPDIGEDKDIQARGDGHGRCNFGASDIPCGCKQFTWVRSEKAKWKKEEK